MAAALDRGKVFLKCGQEQEAWRDVDVTEFIPRQRRQQIRFTGTVGPVESARGLTS
jgi:hypothetical protein